MSYKIHVIGTEGPGDLVGEAGTEDDARYLPEELSTGYHWGVCIHDTERNLWDIEGYWDTINNLWEGLTCSIG